MTEDWPILMSFFPEDWLETASASGVLTKLRKDKEAEKYLRTLLIHLACGHSMRETVVRAKMAGLADISDVALLGRLRKAKEWLRSLCLENMYTVDDRGGLNYRTSGKDIREIPIV